MEKDNKKRDSLKAVFAETMNSKMRKSIFSAPRKKAIEYKRVEIHPTVLKGMPAFQLEYIYEKKVIHENIDEFDIIKKCMDLIGG